MKMMVVYHSQTGNTGRMAQLICDGMAQVSGVEAKAFSIDQIDAAWAAESRCVVVGTPTYLASMSAETKLWLDKSAKQYGLAGKLGGAFATANYIHGGAEAAIQSILSHMMVLGMLVYSGGGGHGAPVIHLGPVLVNDYQEQCRPMFTLYGQRMAQKAVEIFA